MRYSDLLLQIQESDLNKEIVIKSEGKTFSINSAINFDEDKIVLTVCRLLEKDENYKPKVQDTMSIYKQLYEQYNIEGLNRSEREKDS